MTTDARYPRAIHALEDAAKFGIHPALDTIECLVRELGSPHDAFVSIQVAGTNGKGSTTRALEALLRGAGLRTGAFLSPHLHDYTEQVLIDGSPIAYEVLAMALEQALTAAGECAVSCGSQPTQFELLTAAALKAMGEARIAWAVLEVGMGGRWDSTSVVTPLVSVLTSVGLDHVEYLGPTLEDIARDKSHVIKRGARACVLGPGTVQVDDVFAARAREQGVPVVRVRSAVAWPHRSPANGNTATPVADGADNLGEPGLVTFRSTPITGGPEPATLVSVLTERGFYHDLRIAGPGYQAQNIACAIAAAEAALDAPLEQATVREALAKVSNPGRFEVVAHDPLVIVDGAHNPHGAHALVAAIDEYIGEPVTFVLGVLADKAADLMLIELMPVTAEFVVTQPASDRARPAADLADLVRRAGRAAMAIEPDVARALATARERGRPVIVTGSLRTVAEAREALGLARPHHR